MASASQTVRTVGFAASRNQNKLLIAISESRESRRNLVHYPVNAGLTS